MQGRLRNLCHEELLINSSVQGSCDLNCKNLAMSDGTLGKTELLDTFYTVLVGLWKTSLWSRSWMWRTALHKNVQSCVLIIAFIISLSVSRSPCCACTLSIPRRWWDMGMVLDHPAMQDGEFDARLFWWGEQRSIFRQAFWWATACVLLLLRYCIEVDYPKREKSCFVWTPWGTWEASVARILARPEFTKGGAPSALVGHFALTVESIK